MREAIRDIERLKHIQKAISDIEISIEMYSVEEINNRPILYYGIVKLMEIIGEAAYMLTNEFKESHPETLWRDIVGMRHILVHGYYQISESKFWRAVHNDIPVLKVQINKYVEEYK